MYIFIKAQAALMAGSLADFLVTIFLVQVFQCWYVTGNAASNITGATAQFIISRHWVFNGDRQKSTTWVQLIKFVVMWVGNIAITAFGVYLLTHHIHLHYLVYKLIVSPLPGVSYSYKVCKKFVFV